MMPKKEIASSLPKPKPKRGRPKGKASPRTNKHKKTVYNKSFTAKPKAVKEEPPPIPTPEVHTKAKIGRPKAADTAKIVKRNERIRYEYFNTKIKQKD